MNRGVRIVGLVGLLASLMAVPAAHAGPDRAQTLTAASSLLRTCEDDLLARSVPSADRSSWTAPARGYLTAELGGGRAADWDLALFRASDRAAIAASTSFTSDERTSTWVKPGERILIQACRRSGNREAVPLTLDFWRGRPPVVNERFAMVSVTISGASDRQRLERLGLDVTHQVEDGGAHVATYSDEERDRLRDAGFDFYPVISDMVARDAADRTAEAVAEAAPRASTLPTGRESYRRYADYTSEMKTLAQQNPALVRSIAIGQSLEGRPIEGVEIAANVNRTDDGRPVYLNFGGHHAREWPASEMPMEFAHELVARWNASDARVRALLQNVRVVIVPIVNPDGFIVSRDANGGVVTPIDDDVILNLGQIVTDSGAYKRKNCRPTMNDATVPCAARNSSGVDLNRNYGAYYAGPGSSSSPSAQSYRGTGPYSEPESEAVHRYSAGVHPTVYITNHTFTEGRWLRQPGFDAPFLPQIEVPTYSESCAANPDDDGVPPDDPGAIAPDEAAMDALGDAMAAASNPDWISELGYESLCDITGASEDWNYFSQGTYGYTPEMKGTNFHANYASMVVAGYGATPGVGVREAYLIAGEWAADPAHHGIIKGTAPPGATLKLHKEFDTPRCESATCDQGNGAPIRDVLDTTLIAPADGIYEWHVNPSGRPLFANETYTMTCQVAGGPLVTRQIGVGRGQVVTENFAEACALAGGSGGGGGGGGTGGGGGSGDYYEEKGSCAGKPAGIVGTAGNDTLKGTKGNDVIVGGKGKDRIKGKGGKDRICGKGGKDKLRGGSGKDKIRGGGGADKINGGSGRDRCKGGKGKDRLRRCP